MSEDFDPSRYVYQQVADRIAAEIASGRLPVGSKLPGERELAEIHGVALGTARRAIEDLRERGLVRTLAAKGTFVIATEPKPDPDPEG